MKVAIGSDHAGFVLKTVLCADLVRKGLECLDIGTDSLAPVDYPEICINVATMVAKGSADWGIVLGGSGQGEQIAANKVDGIRAALCNDPYYAKLARRDNDANVLAIGARIVAPEFALEILDIWMTTQFLGGRHARRLAQIGDYEVGRSSGQK